MNPNVHLAVKTMAAIEAQIESDQGAKFRQCLGQVIGMMGDAYRGQEPPFRKHLGASVLGDKCARKLWMGFRWFTRPRFPGRVLRLFNRGHLEEARFIAMLMCIDVTVWQQDENGKQFRISFAGGHGGGSGDGVGYGIPDAPDAYVQLEFKTHNEKSFKKLKEEGVRFSKYEHYVQMQTYMRKQGLALALYCAVWKDTDEIYMELVPLNPEFADQRIAHGTEIVFMPEAPKKIGNPPSPGNWDCKWCDQRAACHGLISKVIDRNCRTCVNSKPLPSGEWQCTLHNKLLTELDQYTACGDYKVIQL